MVASDAELTRKLDLDREILLGELFDVRKGIMNDKKFLCDMRGRCTPLTDGTIEIVRARANGLVAEAIRRKV